MNLSLFYANSACVIALLCFLNLSESAGVTCGLDGVCRDTPKNGVGTVCSNCYSCTFKNCCNKVFASPYAECKIKGWRAKGYKGNVPVIIGAPRKRDEGCSSANACDTKNGYYCVAYNKGDDKGFCWKKSTGATAASTFALAIAIARLVLL